MIQKQLFVFLTTFTMIFVNPCWSAETSPIQISAAWARPTAGSAGVIYANLYNSQTQEDSLEQVRVCSHICKQAELHTHIKEGDIVRMRPVEAIPLKAQSTTKLKQGGLHIMLLGLKRALNEGETLPVTFVFAKSGEIKIGVPVQRVASRDDTGDNYKHECPCHTVEPESR